MPSPLISQLNYAGRLPLTMPVSHRTVLYRIALLCWLIPLLTGVSIFIGFEIVRFTDHAHVHHPTFGRFAVAGLFTIVGGTGLALIGAIAVAAFAVRRWSQATDRNRQVIAPAALMLLLLGSNFPIAWGVAALALRGF